MSSTKLVSIVVPVLNEQASIDGFLTQVEAVRSDARTRFDEMIEFDYVFVDDGSTDATVAAILDKIEHNDRIQLVELSRNFGKEAALTAGINTASGDAVVPIDVDLQDPPELILEMIGRWQDGYEVVVARRAKRDSDRFLKRLSAAWFYRLHNAVSRTAIPDNVGDFRLMDRAVVDALKQLGETQRFMKGLFAWVGFRTTMIEYERQPRAEGESKFKGIALWNLALEGLTSFSTVPLKIWTYVGAAIASMAFIFSVIVLFQRLFLGLDIPGYAMLAIAVFFFSGVQLLSIGLIGEYLGRVYLEVKQRPIYVVRRHHTGVGPSVPSAEADPASLPKSTVKQEQKQDDAP